MAQQTSEKLNWVNIDTSDLGDKTLNAAHKAFMDANAVAKEKREALEAKLTQLMKAEKVIPEGHEPVFSYRFGKLAVAFQTVKEPKGKQQMLSFSKRNGRG